MRTRRKPLIPRDPKTLAVVLYVDAVLLRQAGDAAGAAAKLAELAQHGVRVSFDERAEANAEPKELEA
jgi:hypothetical protein